MRCPIYGFIRLSEWERDIISHPAFQRLRRIRQLAWTDYVYPGAMHTRFEHSLGVMHMATMLYEGIVERSRDLLKSELGYNSHGLERDGIRVRLAALLHDAGHPPFSHAAEDLFPEQGDDAGERYKHEHYSCDIVREQMADVIDHHGENENFEIRATDIANIIEGSPDAKRALFWRDLIAGQMDADRMDYLLRDSYHCGVEYGRYDWRRLVHTLEAVPGEEGGAPRVGVSEGGLHAAEQLVLARYQMFSQVYFHKTRVVYDHHLKEAIRELLPDGVFPSPGGAGLEQYLAFDDWSILGALAQGRGGEHGDRLRRRDHYREIAHTPETPSENDIAQLENWKSTLGSLLALETSAEKSWYKVGSADIPVRSENPDRVVEPLSRHSQVVRNIEKSPIKQVRLYVRRKDHSEARSRLEKTGG